MVNTIKLSLLVVTPGKWEHKEIPITAAPFLIGREENCDLSSASPFISRRHCLITIRSNAVFIQDLGSTNGTFVDGLAINGEHELANQAQVSIGPFEILVRIKSSEALRACPPVGLGSSSASNRLVEEAAEATILSLGDFESCAPGVPVSQQLEIEGESM
jgi:pSer/pThr/pTyr-binding forkhead associated (FHA) protein